MSQGELRGNPALEGVRKALLSGFGMELRVPELPSSTRWGAHGAS